MLIFGPYGVNISSPTQITGLGGYPDTRAIVVMNESPYLLRITVNGVGIWGIPAQTADICDVGSSFSGTLTIECTDYLLTSINAPSYVVYVQTVGIQDNLYKSLQRGGVTGYPLTLPRLQSIGNAVNTNSVSNTLQNDGNPSGTNIIESTPATASGSTIFINNDGTMTIKGFNASTLTTLLQLVPGASGGGSSVLLSDASRQTEVLGNLKVDGSSFLGIAQIFGALTAKSTSNLDNGNITTDGSGNVTLKSTTFTHGKITQFTVFTGTSSQTAIAHGCSVAPIAIFVNYFASGSNFGSAPNQIPYAWNVGATTCNIVAQTSYNWVAIAILN